MSVEKRRLAAAQRTAALRSGRTSRLRLATTWLAAAIGLSLFGFTVLASAGTFSKPDYAKAVKQLPQGQAIVLVNTSSGGNGGLFGRFARAYSNKELCVVSSSQLSRIEAEYSMGHMTIPVDGADVDVVTVGGPGASDHEMRTLLGDPKLTCQFVRESGIFYLPFDAHTS